jgi:hypothetical protein
LVLSVPSRRSKVDALKELRCNFLAAEFCQVLCVVPLLLLDAKHLPVGWQWHTPREECMRLYVCWCMF